MRRLNTITLVWRNVRRHAERIASEFAVDGRLLQEHIERASKHPVDLASPIGWTNPDHLRQYARRLLLIAKPVLPSGRRELLVCPECADLGCGCLSAEIHIAEGQVTWSELGYENNYDPESLTIFGIGAFVFRLDEYEGLLKGYAAVEGSTATESGGK
jgi:hypothetical protein